MQKSSSSSPRIYTCGTLRYTKRQLIVVFFWLMFAGFVYQLGMSVPGSLLPIELDELGLSDISKMVLLSTISGILNMTVCPYIGFVSDRHRGKWGRRIPYIFGSMPPIVLGIILYAFNQDIGRQFAAWVRPFWEVAPGTMTAIVLGIIGFIYTFFTMWIASVIWYIFNDIIPAEFFGKVMACFNIGTSGSLALYYKFVFPIAYANYKTVLLILAAVYAIGITLTCIFVREGEYPPVEEEKKSSTARGLKGWAHDRLEGLRVFVRESFCHRVYTYKYLDTIFVAMAGGAGAFAYYYNIELGLDLKLIGEMNGLSIGISTFGVMIVAILATQLVNRWHPGRFVVYCSVLLTVSALPYCTRWLFGTLPPQIHVYTVVADTCCLLFVSGLLSICSLPFEMLIFPKSRFGSFCSMQALLRSATAIVFGLIAGVVFDYLSRVFVEHPEFRYRFILVWGIPFRLLAAWMLYKLYRTWGRLGGYRNFKCPASWSADGKEESAALPVRPVSPTALRRCLPAIDGIFAVFTLIMPLFALFQCCWRSNPQTGLLLHYLVPPLAVMLVADTVWAMVRRKISASIQRALAEPEVYHGLLHPGAVMALLCTQVASQMVYIWSNFYASGRLGYSTMVIISGTMLLLALMIGVLVKMEAGIPQPEKLPAAQTA